MNAFDRSPGRFLGPFERCSALWKGDWWRAEDALGQSETIGEETRRVHLESPPGRGLGVSPVTAHRQPGPHGDPALWVPCCSPSREAAKRLGVCG
jgi:hypothetical protein